MLAVVLSAETCVFAYLGMAIFSFQHIVKPAFVIWSIVSIVVVVVVVVLVIIKQEKNYVKKLPSL